MWNGARYSQRYQDVIKYLNDNPDIKVENIIGHSLGGVVSKQLQTDLKKQGFDVGITTYGAPHHNRNPISAD